VRGYALRGLGREIRAGRALFALTVAGVALGVAAVLSIQILNRAALGAFSGSVRAVSGEADLSVLGLADRMPEGLLVEVLAVPGVAAAVPIYRVEAALEADPEAGLEVLGVDLVAAASGPWTPAAGSLAGALATPGWVAVTPALARERGWEIGDEVRVTSGSRRVALRIGALVDLQRTAPLASRRLAVMDIAQAQGLLGAPGRIHQIDVVAADGMAREELAARLDAALAGRARATSPEARTVEAEGLLAAFRLNLTALSLVSLAVGGFLVYAAVKAALTRRREELGLLRSIGATRAQVIGLVLAEVAGLGLLGTALGIPLGWLAARANVDAVSGTLRNLYLLQGIERIGLDAPLVAVAIATGLAGAVLGAAGPALDAARRDPRALLGSITLQAQEERRATPLAIAAAGALAAGLVLQAAVGDRWRPAGFVLALVLLAAVPLAAPALLRAVARLPAPRRLSIAWGVRSLGTRLGATAIAAGALAVAVSMLAGVTIMVASFRETVDRWLEATLRADVYVTTPSWRRARGEATLAPGVVERLAALPGVRAVDRLRQAQVLVAGRHVTISGVDSALPEAEGRVALVDGEPGALAALRGTDGVLVSEPLARKAGLGRGDRVAIPGTAESVEAIVAGVYRDYGSERGALLADLSLFARLFGEGPVQNVALYLAPGVDPEDTVARIRRELPDQALLARSNRTLREEVFAIFEQTFAVTRLLQAMGLLIATVGIALSLLVVARERAAETALLRALGATRGQVFAAFLGRGLGVGALGLVLGLAGGGGLAVVLVRAVNPAWFGWTIGFHLPAGALLGQSALIALAAVIASVYPALRASDTPVAELKRDAL
jgi:putative ABC transport system permease protein